MIGRTYRPKQDRDDEIRDFILDNINDTVYFITESGVFGVISDREWKRYKWIEVI